MIEPFEGVSISTVDSFYKLYGGDEKNQDVRSIVKESIGKSCGVSNVFFRIVLA